MLALTGAPYFIRILRNECFHYFWDSQDNLQLNVSYHLHKIEAILYTQNTKLSCTLFWNEISFIYWTFFFRFTRQKDVQNFEKSLWIQPASVELSFFFAIIWFFSPSSKSSGKTCLSLNRDKFPLKENLGANPDIKDWQYSLVAPLKVIDCSTSISTASNQKNKDALSFISSSSYVRHKRASTRHYNRSHGIPDRPLTKDARLITERRAWLRE